MALSGLSRNAELPAGAVSVHAYFSASPSGSLDPFASSWTMVRGARCWSGPAFASGAWFARFSAMTSTVDGGPYAAPSNTTSCARYGPG